MIRDETGSTLGAIQVRIKDLSSELERITVRVFGGLQRWDEKRQLEHNGDTARKLFQRSVLSRMLHAAQSTNQPPLERAIPLPANTAVKTIEIKLSLPALPEMPSLASIRAKLAALPLNYALIGLLVIAFIIVSVFHPLSRSSSAADTPALKAPGPPTLQRGDPPYSTVLPAGKTAKSLGGWARVSPPGKNPVYAYIDKIDNVHLNVSEQPLPASFQSDTATKIAQLAQNFNATDKFTDGNTTVYVGNSVAGPQSVILAKDKLLILIKSTDPLTNNQWAAYISSLQ